MEFNKRTRAPGLSVPVSGMAVAMLNLLRQPF